MVGATLGRPLSVAKFPNKRDVEGAVPYNSKHNATQDSTKTKADGFPEQAVPTAAKKIICLIIFAKISNRYSV